ncbi:MAG: hypothetical protein J0I28_08595 [Caulobacterales bacterium]|nr:hypothetical protein [Caulobacterales bacterium]
MPGIDTFAARAAFLAAATLALSAHAQPPAPRPAAIETPATNAIANPYRMVTDYPKLGDIKPGGAIGIVPDGRGGIWLQHRSDPGIVHLDAQGRVVARFDVTFGAAHGLCRDRDGNFWAADSGPFGGGAGPSAKGNQVFKFTPEGKLLLTLGKAGVSQAGPDTFVQPAACIETPDGNILIADGHWPRPASGPQDGDRLVLYSRDGKFLRQIGGFGRKPGEFMGPHGLAYDSQGRLFVADRGNNRIQIFDKDFKVIDEWRHFGRPSGVWILKDDTLIVADSESNNPIGGPASAPEGGGGAIRNPGWKTGVRIGSAKDGSLRAFIEGVRPEGLGADESGAIYTGLSGGCDASPTKNCLQKFVRK